MCSEEMSVGAYLGARLKELGTDQAFGVPGDYVLGLADKLIEGGIQWVGCSNELNAGYAADGYARVNGIGCVCVTYGVGGLSLVNACAGANAENVPVVVICGSPRTEAYNPESIVKVHHAIPGNLIAEQKAYEAVTVAAPLINDPGTAAEVIDETLKKCLRLSKPVMIEVPLNVASAPCAGAKDRLAQSPTDSWDTSQPHDKEQCTAALDAATKLVIGARRPAILVGVEVCRVDAQPAVRRLARLLRVPIATTRHGKAAVEEGGSISAGVYQGKLSRAVVKEYVEGADVLIKVGGLHTDFDYVGAELSDEQATVSANSAGVSIKQPSQAEENAAHFKPVAIVPFIEALSNALWAHLGDPTFFTEGEEAADAAMKAATCPGGRELADAKLEGGDGPCGEEGSNKAFQPAALEASNGWVGARNAAVASLEHRRTFDLELQLAPDDKLTANGFVHAVSRWVHNQPVPVTLLADVGDALIATTDMPLRPIDMYVSQAFYSSIGYTVPAAVGVATAHRNAVETYPPRLHKVPGDAHSARRVVTLVGDGAFQMTAQEVATAIRFKLPITYILINNHGDSIERAVHEGPSYNNYNDIPEWRYSTLLHAFGQKEGEGFSAAVDTVGELLAALESANEPKFSNSTNFIEARIGRDDRSDALNAFGQYLKKAAGLA